MRVGTRELQPGIGYALVKEIELGETASGLILPNVSKQDSGRHHEVIDVHPYSIDCGLKVEHNVRAGDRVTLRSGAMRQSMPHFPKQTHLVRIEDVIGIEREAAD